MDTAKQTLEFGIVVEKLIPYDRDCHIAVATRNDAGMTVVDARLTQSPCLYCDNNALRIPDVKLRACELQNPVHAQMLSGLQ